MKKQEKGRVFTAASENEKNHAHFNTNEEQRTRILGYLRDRGSITTAEAREMLGIMHPAGRVQELREKGFKITCNLENSADFNGIFHKMGRYFYLGELQKGAREDAK